MKLKNLKHSYPDMPQDIKDMIEKEVTAQVDTATGLKPKKIKWKKFLIISVAATMAVGTTVFASSKLHEWNVEKKGKYAIKTEVNLGNKKDKILKLNQIPDNIPVLFVKPEYLPEGMVKAFEGQYHNINTPWQGGISYYDEILSQENNSTVVKNVVYNKNITIAGKEALYIELSVVEGENSITNDKLIYVAFPEYYQRLIINVGSDISREEALKFAENLKVRTSNQKKSIVDEKRAAMTPKANVKPFKTTATKEEMKNLHQIGDTINLNDLYDANGLPEHKNITVKLTNVQVADDLSLIKESDRHEFSEVVDENGKLVQNVVSYIQTGDGKNSLDQVIYTKKVNQKLVYATVEYTNIGSTTLNHVLYNGEFAAIVETKDGYKMYNSAEYDKNDDTDTTKCSSLGGKKYGQYWDVKEDKYGKNYIPKIDPGETVTVHIAQVINEDELDKLYYTTDYSEKQFGDWNLRLGFYDVRQK